MLNILLFASSPGVGLTYYLTELSIELKKRGYCIRVVSTDKEHISGLKTKLKKNNISLYGNSYVDSLSPQGIIKGSLLLRKIIKKDKIDIIHANALSQFVKAYLASRLLNRKPAIILTLHSCLPFYMKIPILLKVIGSIADLIMPVCDKTTEYLLNVGVNSSKVYTVNNGLKIQDYVYNQQLKSKYNKKIVVAYIATLNPWKGHVYYINAAANILEYYDDVEFLIVGDGPLWDDLKQKVDELNINTKVKFLGQVSNADIPKIIEKVDIGVSTSLTEQFPYNILELMAAGKPVVATDVGCVSKMVKNGVNGFVVPPKDSLSLAENIIKLLKDPETACKMGENSRKRVENLFSMNNMLNKLEISYEKALGNFK